ncbi:serine/threonine-protein kinase [Streptomyces flavofungini]|uniref:serine/threonine-protein kinase n=1 Tax=Streptomyces flavofungini TaxID=68200 RepID=UPI0025AF0F78|nr:serine/threonine-protein kinase [Streptomyces flavofungini]WJV50967.1 serine/threonine-protein kinase [Streptomyces flavofungini]
MNHPAEVFKALRADDPPLVADYRLAARLGAGGMGRVYLSHTRGGRPVAIKVVRPELADDPEFRRRFRREVEAARRVRGAYTAELIDADADGVPPWLATLYVPGPSLADAVARRGPLPVSAVLWLVAGVAEALQAIHGEGIVHRDLKPSNVLLAADGPRVIDFGISLASDITSHTVTGSAVGTPQFMAPEQASGGEVTAATDVFALGQTAAFAALGEPLYGDGPSVSVLYRIVHSEPDLSRVPEQLRPIIARCLVADPALRATPAEIVHWCRQRLGRDPGPGPEVWREVMGPELRVPGPVPDPTPVHTMALMAQPRPTGPGEQRARRRRTGLITAAALAAGALVLGGSTWTVLESRDGSGDRTAAGASPVGADASAESDGSSSRSDSEEGSRGSAPDGSKSDGSKSGGAESRESTESGTKGSTSDAPDPSRAIPYPFQWLDEKNSLNIKEPVERKDRKGDIRFVCNDTNCSLESDTSVITMLYGKPGATRDSCRIALRGADSRRLPLAAAAAGSEICVKHPSGDIALLVVQVKSTALPKSGISFLTADMTVWRA